MDRLWCFLFGHIHAIRWHWTSGRRRTVMATCVCTRCGRELTRPANSPK